MKNFAILLLLLPLLAIAADENLPQKLSSFTDSGCGISEPIVLDQVERQSLKEMKAHAPRVPQVPFGFSNAEWLSFKATARTGDKVVQLVCSGTVYWRGYAIIRADMVVATFVIELS